MCLGTISVGLKKNPNRGGFEPRCVIELNTAKFFTPLSEIVPIKFADLYPEQELIRLILNILSRFSIYSSSKCIYLNTFL